MKQLKYSLNKLRKPSVFISLISQIVSLFMIFGVDINESLVLQAAAIICSILVTLGIMSNPNTEKKGYGDDLLPCSDSGQLEHHVMVNGCMVCQDCGAVHYAKPPLPAQCKGRG